MALTKEEVTSIIKKYGANAKDTGSSQVQIALITARIDELNRHLKTNAQDAEARRSLLSLVGKRHTLLGYLAKTDTDAYAKLIASLGLRK